MSIDTEIRELSALSDLAAANQLLEQVWESPNGGVQVDLLRAMALGGGYVAGAYRHGKMVGAAMGFLARARPNEPVHLHSHVAGVLPEAQGLHVGLNLKLHQRSWAMDHGIDDIQWTFDPILVRNATFNLKRLGARPIAYHVDYYGEMVDAFNAGGDSDRLLVSWRVTSPRVLSALAGTAQAFSDGLPVGLSIGPNGEPRIHDVEGASVQLWEIPQDMTIIRSEAPELARKWREVTRHLFTNKFAEGASFTFVANRGYLVTTTVMADESAITAAS